MQYRDLKTKCPYAPIEVGSAACKICINFHCLKNDYVACERDKVEEQIEMFEGDVV